jgi:hypothetical protein
MTSPWTPDIREALNALLAGHHTSTGDTAGAALAVTDPDGHLAYQAPLARMSRIDDQDPAVLWIRPVTGRTEPVDGEETTVPTYSL